MRSEEDAGQAGVPKGGKSHQMHTDTYSLMAEEQNSAIISFTY